MTRAPHYFYTLIAVKTLDWIPHSFLGTFIISYMMRAYNNAIGPTGLYNIFFYAAIFLAAPLTFRMVIGKNIVHAYRIGMGFMITLGTIAIMGDASLNYIWILGGIYGIAGGNNNKYRHGC